MTNQDSIVSVEQLCINFPEHHFEAVRNVDFSLAKGKTLAIVGESGSGKSLIALSLIGLQPRQAVLDGKILLNIRDNTMAETLLFTQKQWQQHRGNSIGFIFQEPMSALNALQCVGKQIQESIALHQNVSRKEAKQKTLEWIARVKLPDPETIYRRFPHQLSGGQKQRIMIAMAMCNSPALLLADEPTTALDATVQKDIVELMKSLQQETAMVFITHDLALAAGIADNVLVMQQGNPVEYGPAEQVLHAPKASYTKALLACRPQPGSKGKRLPVITDYLSGPQEAEAFAMPTPLPLDHELLLDVRDLSVWYPEGKSFLGTSRHYTAVDKVSFNIRKGRTLGLVGESGCGKSTIGKALVGLSPIKDGQVWFDGKDIAAFKGHEWNSVRKDIQLIFQDPFASLNPRHTVAEIITEPLLIHRMMRAGDRVKEAQRLLQMVGLPEDAATRYPHQFSGGQRQRIGIARALALKPSLLICDESVSALDVSVQAQILNLLKELQGELGLSYLFISHDLSVVHYMADEILVMRQGKIVERASPDELLYHPREAYTQKLVAAMPEFDRSV